MPVYEVPVDGGGVHGDPYHPRHADEVGDGSRYLLHYRGDVVYVSCDEAIDVYAEAVEDEDSSVALHSESPTSEYPAPAGEEEPAAGEYPCPDCDRVFDTPQGRAGHSRTHSDD